MSRLKDAARQEHEKTLKDQIDTYARLIEVCKRSIEIQQQEIRNYEAKLEVLRESLTASKARRDTAA